MSFKVGERVRVANVLRGGSRRHIGVVGTVADLYEPYVYVVPDKPVGPMVGNEYAYHSDYYILERENAAEELINEDWS